MKRKPFIMQGICLFMLLFGMHLCVYSAFLKAGSLYKFAVVLAVASLWFSFLAAAPFRRIEYRMKYRFKIPVIKHPAAAFLLMLTLLVWGILSIRYMGHLQKDFVTLRDAVAYRQSVYYYQMKGAFNPYEASRHGASGTSGFRHLLRIRNPVCRQNSRSLAACHAPFGTCLSRVLHP